MTSRDFAYWLQGFFEISNAETITPEQTNMIKNHLNLAFKHEIDPSMGNEKHQQELNAIHTRKPFQIPRTEEEAIAKWGKKPSPEYKYNMHGWYDPAQGTPRC